MRDITILIVEDDPDIQTLLARILGSAGYRTITAATGAAALTHPIPDLVILDQHLPDTTATQLAEHYRNTLTPFIFLTADGAPETANTATRLGASSYLSKPIRNAELLAAVTAALIKVRETARLRDRQTINLAIGILAGLHHTTSAEAERRLAERSRITRQPKIEVARGIIDAHDRLMDY